MNRHTCHIVIVEDNEPDLVMIQFSLRDAGVACDITSFSDGAEALRHVNDPSSRVPDLMILDFNIPNVEGTEILNSVRGNPRWSEVGVFIFTASQSPADKEKEEQTRSRRMPDQTDGSGGIGGDRPQGRGLLDKTGNHGARSERHETPEGDPNPTGVCPANPDRKIRRRRGTRRHRGIRQRRSPQSTEGRPPPSRRGASARGGCDGKVSVDGGRFAAPGRSRPERSERS